jgi:hypothetical protein
VKESKRRNRLHLKRLEPEVQRHQPLVGRPLSEFESLPPSQLSLTPSVLVRWLVGTPSCAYRLAPLVGHGALQIEERILARKPYGAGGPLPLRVSSIIVSHSSSVWSCQLVRPATNGRTSLV